MATNENLWAWSITAIDNATADASIVWSEGQDPATVNNSARSMMAAIAKQTDVQGGNVTVGGTANAITITTGQAIDAGHQALGFRVCFKAIATNTGATTVAVDGLPAVGVLRPNGDALSAGDIVNGGFHDIAFGTTNYRLLASPAVIGTGSLAGDNSWTGTNAFHGDTSIGEANDGVIIKGTSVSPFMATLFSNSSASALRTSIGIGTADNVTFNSVTTPGYFNTNEYRYGGVNVTVNPSFLIAMLGTLTQVAFGPGWTGGSGAAQVGGRMPYRSTGGLWGYWLFT